MDFDFPLEIVIRDIPRTDGLEQRIHDKVGKLAGMYTKITRCRVVVEAPHQRQQKGQAYQVHLTLGVPGPEIVVTRESGKGNSNEELSAAVRDAFDAARRQLQDRLGKIRKHPQTAKGEVPEIPSEPEPTEGS